MLQVTVNPPPNSNSFIGLLLFGENAQNVHVGIWTNLQSTFQTLDQQCSKFGVAGSTLSHSSNAVKSGPMSFSWTAPSVDAGNVTFRGLVVTSSSSVWMQFSPTSITASSNSTNTTSGSAPTPNGNTRQEGSLWIALAAVLSVFLVNKIVAAAFF